MEEANLMQCSKRFFLNPQFTTFFSGITPKCFSWIEVSQLSMIWSFDLWRILFGTKIFYVIVSIFLLSHQRHYGLLYDGHF